MTKLITVVWQKANRITYKRFPAFPLTYEEADKFGEERGYGRTVVIGYELPLPKRMVKAVTDFFEGIRSNYPICCVINFCIDRILARPSVQLRWSSRTEYVECTWHLRRNGGKEEIPEDLY